MQTAFRCIYVGCFVLVMNRIIIAHTYKIHEGTVIDPNYPITFMLQCDVTLCISLCHTLKSATIYSIFACMHTIGQEECC